MSKAPGRDVSKTPGRDVVATTVIGTATALLGLAVQNPPSIGSVSPELFWPPSRRAAPFIMSVCAGVIMVVALCFVRSSSSSEHHLQKKKRLIMAQLTQAMRWDEHDSTEEEQEKGKERRPPETAALFEMLYDDVEERHVTHYGIDQNCAEYKRALALFKERLPLDLAEAARCTRIARGVAEPGDAAYKDDLKRIVLFKDGVKLRELVELYDKKIRWNFGDVLPRADFKAIQASHHHLERDLRRGGYSMLFALLKPHLPLYCLAVALMAFDSAVGAANWHGLTSPGRHLTPTLTLAPTLTLTQARDRLTPGRHRCRHHEPRGGQARLHGGVRQVCAVCLRTPHVVGVHALAHGPLLQCCA